LNPLWAWNAVSHSYLFIPFFPRSFVAVRGTYTKGFISVRSRLASLELAALALTNDDKWILTIALLFLMVLIIIYELKVMRGKAKEVKRANLRKDQAHNAVHTMTSVVDVVSRQGADVGKARVMVKRAREAFTEGDYSQTMRLCESAKIELAKCRQQKEPEGSEPGDALELLATEIVDSERRQSQSDSYRGTKLPADQGSGYMAAKFEMGTARDELGRAAENGKETGDAEEMLSKAEDEFERGNYPRALSLAVKARKSLSNAADSDTIPLSPSGVREETEGVALRCTSCSSMVLPDDDFCSQCGAPATKELRCPECDREVALKDKFCRKCGTKVR